MKVSRRSILFSLLSTAIFGIKDANASLTPIKPFSFGFLSDIHLTNDLQDTHILYHESQLFLQEAVKRLNALDLDFVIFGGDQVETPGKNDNNWNLFIDIVQNLKCDWNFVLGDRDIGGNKIVDKMRTFGVDWKGKGIETNTPYWSYDLAHNVHIVGLDTSKNKSKAGYISPKQLAWLKDDLQKNYSKFTMVVSHHPILAPAPFDGTAPWSNYTILDSGDVREALASSPYVKLCLSGHVGVNKLTKERSIYYSSSSFLTSYPCTFKVFRVDSDKILMETYQIGFKSLVNKSKEALIESNLAYYYQKTAPKKYLKVAEGMKVDWDAELPLSGGMTASYRKKPKRKKKKTNSKPKKKKKFRLF